MKQLALGTLLALVMILAARAETEAYRGPQRFITIGTGVVTGMYHATGKLICGLVNERREEHGIRCSAKATGGSKNKISMIRAGELDMGMVGSGWQYDAYHGTGKLKDAGPFRELRAVFSLYPEPVTILARRDSGVKHIDDLRGKRLNIGSPGSTTRATWEVIEQALGWRRSDLSLAAELKVWESAQALCDNQIDAYVLQVGHPSALTDETVNECDVVLVEVAGPAIDQLVANNAFYRFATIPGGIYRGNQDDIKTFGLGLTVVNSTDTTPDVVYWVVKLVFENLSAIKDWHSVFTKLKKHSVFADLKKKEMVRDSLSAPLHEGALKYYREAGLM